MTDYTKTRGWRNNNPLNIKHSNSAWQGMMPKQDDKLFVHFMTRSYGYRAAIKIMLAYYHVFTLNNKLNTINNIIRRWAPDGNEENYIKVVEKRSGIDRNRLLPRPDTEAAVEFYVKILGAMTCVECGCPVSEIPWNDIRGGYWLAFHIGKH